MEWITCALVQVCFVLLARASVDVVLEQEELQSAGLFTSSVPALQSDLKIPYLTKDSHNLLCFNNPGSKENLDSLSRFSNVLCRQEGKSSVERVSSVKTSEARGVEAASISSCRGDEPSVSQCLSSKIGGITKCEKVLAISCTNCRKTVVLQPAASVIISSPAYPVYLPLTNCVWNITSTPDMKILIKFLEFDLPPPVYDAESGTFECVDGALEILLFNKDLGRFVLEGRYCRKEIGEEVFDSTTLILRYNTGSYKPTDRQRRGVFLKVVSVEGGPRITASNPVALAVIVSVPFAVCIVVSLCCLRQRKLCCWKSRRERIVVVGMEPGIPIPMILPRPDISPRSGMERQPLSFQKIAQLNRMRRNRGIERGEQSSVRILEEDSYEELETHLHPDILQGYRAVPPSAQGSNQPRSTPLPPPSTAQNGNQCWARTIARTTVISRILNHPVVTSGLPPTAEVRPRVREGQSGSACHFQRARLATPIYDSFASSGESYIDPRKVPLWGKREGMDDLTKRLFFKVDSPGSSIALSNLSQMGPDDVFEPTGKEMLTYHEPIKSVQLDLPVIFQWKKFPSKSRSSLESHLRCTAASAVEISQRSDFTKSRSSSLPLMRSEVN